MMRALAIDPRKWTSAPTPRITRAAIGGAIRRPRSTGFGAIFGGAHPGGMNAVFVDGSVHNIQWSIPQPVFQALCNRHDGISVDLSDVN